MHVRAAIGVWLAASLGCVATSPQPASEKPRPTRRPPVQVSEVHAVGSYLDATLRREEEVWRLFFPRSEDCEQLLIAGGTVRYAPVGPFGRVVGENRQSCEPLGTGSLLQVRDDQPRRRSRFLMPREQAAFRDVDVGEHNLLVRGRFPLALEIRWPEPMDSVAWLPAVPDCHAVLEHSTATMEFHAEGPDVFVLEAEGIRCPIEGFSIPVEVE